MIRTTISMTEEDLMRLKKVVARLGLSSPGQLLRLLLNGSPEQIDVIAKGFKELDSLF
jgi:hypothetical protein